MEIKIRYKNAKQCDPISVIATSNPYGKKVISNIQSNSLLKSIRDAHIVGYVLNPEKTRMAVIMDFHSREFIEYGMIAFGCHLTIGFTNEFD